MKWKVGLGVLAVALVAVVAFVFLGGYQTQRFDHLNAQDIHRVDFWFCTGECVTVTEPDEVEQVIDLLQSLKLKPWFGNGKAGYLCHLEFYDETGEMGRVYYGAGQILDGDRVYNMDRDYGDEFRALFEQLKASNP